MQSNALIMSVEIRPTHPTHFPLSTACLQVSVNNISVVSQLCLFRLSGVIIT